MNDCILVLCCLLCLGGCGCNCGNGRGRGNGRSGQGGCGSNSDRDDKCPCKEPRFEPRFDSMPYSGSGKTCGCEEKSSDSCQNG